MVLVFEALLDSLRLITKTNGFGAAYARVMLYTSWKDVLISISSLFCSPSVRLYHYE